MLKWLWRKLFKPVVKIEKIILTGQTLTYNEKWNNKPYLLEAKNIIRNDVFCTEVIERIRLLREQADIAENTDTLRGLQIGIKLLKSLLEVSANAKEQIKSLDGGDSKNEKNETDSEY